jgi:hypothetical protein
MKKNLFIIWILLSSFTLTYAEESDDSSEDSSESKDRNLTEEEMAKLSPSEFLAWISGASEKGDLTYETVTNDENDRTYFPTLKDAKNYIYKDCVESEIPTCQGLQFSQSNEKAKTILSALYDGFTKVNPELALKVGKMPQIIVLTIPNDLAFSYNGVDEANAKNPYLIVISENMLLDKEQAEGVLAHELSHAVIQHGDYDDEEGDSRWHYKNVAGKEERIVDPETISEIENWMTAFEYVGLIEDEKAGDLPATLAMDPDYSYLLGALVIKAGDQNVEECIDGYNLFVDRSTFLSARFDAMSSTFILSDEDKVVLDTEGQKLAVKLKHCYKEVKKEDKEFSFEALMSYGLGMSLEGYQDLLSYEDDEGVSLRYEQEKTTFNSYDNPVNGLMALMRKNKHEMQSVKKILDVDQLRFYSHEDEADISAVKILHAMGKTPRGLNNFLIKSIKSECNAILENGEEPIYGIMLDDHHSSCWRKWRNNKLYESLQKDEAVIVVKSLQDPTASLRKAL